MVQVARSKASCSSADLGMRALLQAKIQSTGADCETMCKRLGTYPKCQCPGFAGEPADTDDSRGCYTKNCQEPSNPCPNDAFVTCVKENTRAAALLQWQAVFAQVDKKFGMMLQAARSKASCRNA